MPVRNSTNRVEGKLNQRSWSLWGRSLWQPTDRQYLQQVGILAVAYGVAAYIAASVPGVYSIGSSVWPSAGIAQGLMLLWGWRIWPGISLGIFLFDLLNSDETLPLLSMLGVVGATLQALVSFWLFKRFRVNTRLHLISDVFKLLFFGALVATQISCTVGAIALFWEGKIPWDQVTSVRWSWWLGDTVGVIVFAPTV
ncbi:MAG: MASE1 domain-containing protein [Cyanophyceae cyanobacterium]